MLDIETMVLTGDKAARDIREVCCTSRRRKDRYLHLPLGDLLRHYRPNPWSVFGKGVPQTFSMGSMVEKVRIGSRPIR